MTMRRLCVLAACSLAFLVTFASPACAQEAVTLTGHVISSSGPLRGASIQIPELDLNTTTDAQGRYSFIISSTRVRGQTVTVAARYLRYRPQSASIVLVGGALVQDFELRSGTDAVPEPTRPVPGADTARRAPVERPPAAAAATPTRIAAGTRITATDAHASASTAARSSISPRRPTCRRRWLDDWPASRCAARPHSAGPPRSRSAASTRSSVSPSRSSSSTASLWTTRTSPP